MKINDKRIKSLSIFVSIICFAFLISGCGKYPDDLKQAISKAGPNRKELIKVIDHYKQTKERKKLKAAYFLIGNMVGKQSSYSPLLPGMYEILSDSVRSRHSKGLDKKSINEKVKQWTDSLQLVYGLLDTTTFLYNDLQIITAEYLIENIDMAFEAWKNPWSKQLNFKEFCEYILPYRVFDEPLQNWRKNYFESFKHYRDSVKNPGDPEEICLLINNKIARDFEFHSNFYLPQAGANDILKYPIGVCEQRYLLIISALRSIGVPVRLDYMPQFNKWPGNHHWTTMLDKDKQIIPFNGGEPYKELPHSKIVPLGGGGAAAKVYHITYALQKRVPAFKTKNKKQFPELFKKTNYIDVSTEYSYKQIDLKIPLKIGLQRKKDEFVYLSSFGYGLNIIPVDISQSGNDNVKFKNVGAWGMYVVVLYKNNKYTPISDVININEAGDEIKYFKPEVNNIQSVSLLYKYPVADSMVNFSDAMIGAKFQGSNKIDFNDSVSLFKIKTAPPAFVTSNFNNNRKFRYIRYLSSDTGKVNMAEIEFYGLNTDGIEIPLKGKVIGYSKDEGAYKDFIKLFDWDIRSYLSCPAGSWAGIDLGEGNETKITKVRYLARNTLNVVEPGNLYELFYFNNGWVSLGKKEAEEFYIDYKVPKNALLMLKNHTQGKEERVFVIDKNGNQEWW